MALLVGIGVVFCTLHAGSLKLVPVSYSNVHDDTLLSGLTDEVALAPSGAEQ